MLREKISTAFQDVLRNLIKDVEQVQSSICIHGHVVHGDREVVDVLAHHVLQIFHLVGLGQIQNFKQVCQRLVFKVDVLLLNEPQQIQECLFSGLFDYHNPILALLKEGASAKEDRPEVLVVHSKDHLVGSDGVHHLVLTVQQLKNLHCKDDSLMAMIGAKW